MLGDGAPKAGNKGMDWATVGQSFAKMADSVLVR